MSALTLRIIIAVLALSTIFSACTFVRVYAPADSKEPTGQVEGLKQILMGDKQPLTIVFIHGVGDTCRGYAVGDAKEPNITKGAFLGDSAAAGLGLTIKPNSQQINTEISSTELGIGQEPPYKTPVILLRTRDYIWNPPGRGSSLDVHAVEITWSPMTRWIKNTMLGYDTSGITLLPFLTLGRDIEECTSDPVDTLGNAHPIRSGFEAPRRVLANSMLKWSVLDRSLADALIYTGTYGEAMQRGMAAALCRILTGADKIARNQRDCAWPQQGIDPKGHFIFVTHSLGSRMLYDTLLQLTAPGDPQVTIKYPDLFPPGYAQQAEKPINEMLDETAGLYMMANQMTMLGAANVPLSANFNDLEPRLEMTSGNILGEKQPAPGAQAAETRTSVPDAARNDPIYQLLNARAKRADGRKATAARAEASTAEGREAPTPNMTIVSFNDSNDLLTWHLPEWYETVLGDPDYHVKITDVFVRNSTRWFWFFEWPPYAHHDYFKNSEVRAVMLCGAQNTRANSCGN